MSNPRPAARQSEGPEAKRLAIRFGTALLILGILACMALILMDTLTTFEISMAMMLAGVLQVSHSVAAHRRGWSGLAIAGGLLYLVAAVAVLIKPLVFDGWTEFLLVASLGCSGISRIGVSRTLPGSPGRWELLSGITSLVAAALVYAGLPSFTLWPIAFVVALDIIIEGATLANAGYAMRTNGRQRTRTP